MAHATERIIDGTPNFSLESPYIPKKEIQID
jgi:hypothetical protein